MLTSQKIASEIDLIEDITIDTNVSQNSKYVQNFFSLEENAFLAEALFSEISWKEEFITLFNKTYLQPRLVYFQGNENISYKYSKKIWPAAPWTETVLKVKIKVEEFAKQNLNVENFSSFNSCLCNLYRNGQDSMGWHSDNEPELGKFPTIASVSFGASRDFFLRKAGETKTFQKLKLSPGSLLLMHSNFQNIFQHSVPKRKGIEEWRINLTFRTILNKDTALFGQNVLS